MSMIPSTQERSANGDEKKYNKLTKDEEKVILYKGTERPFTGKYWDFFGHGTYFCKRCNAPLFRSKDKFESECGWPSFDDALPGAVRQIPDADAMRTEIICNNCGAHLGHIFNGEKLTPKDERYCVNSISMYFVADSTDAEKEKQIEIMNDTAYFAGGCFWGVEYYFENLMGIVSTQVGYMGGTKDNPTYEEVCSGKTGHAEVLRIIFNPAQVAYESLAKLFFEIHDPTELNRQGPDIGYQYRSAIFFNNQNQKKTAQILINILKNKGYAVVTTLEDSGNFHFWKAEEYHQDYYKRKGTTPYCHVYKKKF